MPVSRNRTRWWRGVLFLFTAFFIIAIDQVSKEWIRINIPSGGLLTRIGCLSIVNIQNTGAAFGILQNQSVLLSIVSIAGIIIILIFFKYIVDLGVSGVIALSMIFAGAVGNQIDRFRYGYVTDFIYVRIWDNLFWPAFNVADSAITIGSISLAIIILIGLRKKCGTAGNTGEREGGESGSQNISS